jgi:hypothetical protein
MRVESRPDQLPPSGGRYVVLALGPGPGPAMAAGSPPADIEVVAVEAADVARVWLQGSRPWSALVVDRRHPGLDRDLVETARRQGVAVLVTGQPVRGRSRDAASAAGIEAPLRATASPLARPVASLAGLGATMAALCGPPQTDSAAGAVVAVCGPGGTGTSTVAMAVATGLAQPGSANLVLADLSLRPAQALLHGLPPSVPGLEAMVHAHRTRWLTAAEAREHTVAPPGRPYRLLPGLRRSSHWTAIGPVTFDAALHSLRRAFATVVADVTGDLEGEAESGSADLEARNHMARRAVAEAAAVVVVGLDGPSGRVALDTTVDAVHDQVGETTRTIRVLNRAAGVLDPGAGDPAQGAPVSRGATIRLAHLGPTGDLAAWGQPVAEAVSAILRHRPPRPSTRLTEPARIPPGAIGQWRGVGG